MDVAARVNAHGAECNILNHSPISLHLPNRDHDNGPSSTHSGNPTSMSAAELTPDESPLPEADARLLDQIRRGDADAGHRFIRDHYPSIYRYLLSLTGRVERAEDLA